MKNSNALKEQQIPGKDSLKKTVDMVKENAKINPDQYLKDSVVPEGGE